MKLIYFTKMVAAGNDFVVVDALPKAQGSRLKDLAMRICDRKYGIGADGFLLLEKTKRVDVRMRIFNADGSEAQMCGNGARCAALYSSCQPSAVSCQQKIKIRTKAGIIESEVNREGVRIKLTDPKDIKLDIPIKINNRNLKVNFINTGVPHAVVFVQGLQKIDIASLGRQIRYHKRFAPAGANADFVEAYDDSRIKVRTYERGVEDETLACGTGSVAAALVTVFKGQRSPAPKLNKYSGIPINREKVKGQWPEVREVNVGTRSGEILKVYFERARQGFKNVWLEGKAEIVYKGAYYV